MRLLRFNFHSQLCHSLLWGVTIATLAGCNSSSASKTPTTKTAAAEKEVQPEKSAEASGISAAANIKVEMASFDELKQRIASYKDRVVVVDAWSTSCLPCMKEFPHLVELARRWPEDVVCISMNLDFAGLPNKTPADGLPAVTKFLESKAADPVNLVNLLCTEPDEQMYGKFEIESIPAIFVYDRQGALASKLTVDTGGPDGVTYDGDVIPLVEKLIEK